MHRRDQAGLQVSYHFFAEGEPKGQPRVKAARRGKFVRIYTPSVADAWKAAVASASLVARPSALLTGPLLVRLVFWMPRPRALQARKYAGEKARPHTSKPDIDNLAKAVLDAMHLWWEDDDQVTVLMASKWYAPVGRPTGVDVHIQELQA